MDIRRCDYSNVNNFKAVQMSPHPKKWNQQVLSAVLNSKTIEDIVIKDAANNKDTIIKFSKVMDPPYPECPAHRDMFLHVKSGDGKEINLSSKSTYQYIPGGFFKEPKEIKTGPEDVAKDLSEQIARLDGEIDAKDAPKEYRNLAYLNKIGKGLVYSTSEGSVNHF